MPKKTIFFLPVVAGVDEVVGAVVVEVLLSAAELFWQLVSRPNRNRTFDNRKYAVWRLGANWIYIYNIGVVLKGMGA